MQVIHVQQAASALRRGIPAASGCEGSRQKLQDDASRVLPRVPLPALLAAPRKVGYEEMGSCMEGNGGRELAQASIATGQQTCIRGSHGNLAVDRDKRQHGTDVPKTKSSDVEPPVNWCSCGRGGICICCDLASSW